MPNYSPSNPKTMTIINNGTTIEYSATPDGQFFQKVTKPGMAVARLSKNPERMLKLLLHDAIQDELAECNRILFMSKAIPWWEMNGGPLKAGQFNVDLYRQVIQAKRERGMLTH